MSKEVKESFVFYRSFAKSIEHLPASMQLPLYKAITEYALDTIEPNFGNCTDKYVLDALWESIRPQLDANQSRYLNGCKGGAPKGSRNNPNGRRGNKPKTNQELTENKPNDNVNVNDNDIKKEIFIKETSRQPRRTFVRPQLEEVKAYCDERKNGIDADKFFNHYESIGWKVGKNPMKDWKAAIRTWERNTDNTQPQRPSKKRLATMEDLI
mgnify:CR=1 FL=1